MSTFLGESLNSALSDLFLWETGPCVRDKLSHGKLELSILNRRICIDAILLSIKLAGKFSLEKSSSGEILSEVMSWEYVPHYHPKLDALKNVVKSFVSLEKFGKFFEQVLKDQNSEDIGRPQFKDELEIVCEKSEELKTLLEKTRASNLFEILKL